MPYRSLTFYFQLKNKVTVRAQRALLWQVEEGIASLRAGVRVSYELYNMGAGNLAQVLCKSITDPNTEPSL